MANAGDRRLLRVLTYLMFAMFAMTTDSVGVIIPHVIERYSLGMTAGGAFQYATMGGIALAALGLGFMADRVGRKVTIIIGLVLFGLSSALFAVGEEFLFFVGLLFVGGLGIGVFKSGALALIGDISGSTREHSATMNTVEGFFGIGAIVGPAIVAWLLQSGADWKWLYVVAAVMCGGLVLASSLARYPARPTVVEARPSAGVGETLKLMGDPHALGFGLGLMLYVAAEAAVYVWAPTYLAGYEGQWGWFAVYAVSIFFVLRAAGRFLGAWLLSRLAWQSVLAICSGGMFVCFAIAVFGDRGAAALALPASGLFMSVLYPTINSKGISCFDKGRHGQIAGLLLFFTCVSAVLAPLAMGLLGDAFDDPKYSLYLAAACAFALTLLAVWNAVADPTRTRLNRRDEEDYVSPEDTASAMAPPA
ncbi:MFS transporter [Brevundimonas sp. NPDC092305]|uniref:MFS transporter n=1 Tax=Brevundimonas sp. NPDC092305 TaxID=3363957 RepID=UPI00380DBB23